MVLLLTVVSRMCAAAESKVSVDFQRQVRPILADKCFSCHGPDEQHRKADLRLDTREGVFGRSGTANRNANPNGSLRSPVVIPRNLAESELWNRISSEDNDVKMPPPEHGKSLTVSEKESLKNWIEQGAEWLDHWAYVPPQRPKVTLQNELDSSKSGIGDSTWIDGTTIDNDIDRLVLRQMIAGNHRPENQAAPATLARRLWLDLTGIIPTWPEVERFVDDCHKDADQAYQTTVETLLSSPHYAERMTLFWLDLVRYADTVGYHGDQEHHISPYRDYVIQAFHENMPFDRFTREQIAGDLLPDATVEQKIASGYNRLIQTSHEGGVQQGEYLAKYSSDRVRNLGAAWLGATIGCCECHDHKFDPITQRDFYRLAAFFADIDDIRSFKGGDASPTKREPEMDVTTILVPDDTRRTMITVSIEPRPIRVLSRGDWMDTTGEIVEPGVPSIFSQLTTSGRATRLDLADWLTSRNNPLVARVFVNRIWKLFFGIGLSKNMEDFGAQGDAPDHPELLDLLAVNFIDSGWNVKQLIRRIVLSKSYRQAVSQNNDLAASNDGNDKNEHSASALISSNLSAQTQKTIQQTRWRLDAEFVRDNALAVSGLLVRKIGGRSARPYQPDRYYRFLNFPKRDYVQDNNENQYRRGLYMHWQRAFLHPMLKAFDAPCREESTCSRPQSNTPQSALVLLNDPTFVEASRAFAERILRENGHGRPESVSDVEKITWAWRTCLSRTPSTNEIEVMIQLLSIERLDFEKNHDAAREYVKVGLSPVPEDLAVVELAAWTTVARTLFNLSEFITRN